MHLVASKQSLASYRLLSIAGLILALALRVLLADYSFWFDEWASLLFSDQPLVHLWGPWMVRETNPPLFYTLLKYWSALGAHSIVMLRLLPIVAGVANIAVLAWLCRRWHSRRAALIMVLLMALSPGHVVLSQMLRAYAFAMLGASISLGGLLLWWDGGRSRIPGMIVYVAGAVLAFYSHTTMLLWQAVAPFTMLLCRAGELKARNWQLLRDLAVMVLAAAIGAIVVSVALPVTGLVALKMLPFDNKSEFQIVVDMPAGTRVEETEKVLRALGAHLATVPEVTHYQAYAGLSAPINFNGLVRQYYLRSGGNVGDIQVNLQDKHLRKAQSHIIAMRERPALQAIGKQFNANVKVIEVPPGPPVLAPIVAEVYGPTDEGRNLVAKSVRALFSQQSGVVDVDDSTISAAPRQVLLINRQKAAQMGVSQQAIVSTLRAALAGESSVYAHDQNKYAGAIVIRLPKSEQDSLDKLLSLGVRNSQREIVPIRQLVTSSDTQREQPIYHKDLLPVTYVVGDMAGKVDSPLYGMFGMRSGLNQIQTPNGKPVDEYFIQQPTDPYQHYAVKWDGEWQMTYETFRDMGAAYAVGLVLIYLLVVAQFGSYLVPLIIMAPIPLTIIGVMPGHALLGAPYTATSMIGMIALAGIIVRNSILLVDFIRLQVSQGVALKDAVVASAITRAQPIVLTGLAAMMGAFFILDDPIFNGLAISLIFGIFVSTALTLLVIPLLYFMAFKNKPSSVISGEHA